MSSGFNIFCYWKILGVTIKKIYGPCRLLCALMPSVSVGWLAVRPFVGCGGCGGLVLVCFVSAIRICAVAFPCPCRFGAFFGGFLPCSVVGWCVCLSVGFRGLWRCLVALLGGCPCFWLVVVYPIPIFGRVSGGRITPLKFPRKIFQGVGVWKEQGSFF